MNASDCPLCHPEHEDLLWSDARCRVILVGDADYPGFCRVIWQAHVREMTDLSAADRSHCMAIVFAVEAALRELLAPDKINLATLGNVVPHVHWHVIPRFVTDAHFPAPVWAGRQREGDARGIDRATLVSALQRLITAQLGGGA